MKNKAYKMFSVISLLIPLTYSVANLFAIILLNVNSANENFIHTIFTADLLTWHIYGIFAIATLIVKYLKDKKYNANIILHIIFTIISFIEIYYLISRGF